MWLFIWKKYEDSWIATFVSFIGNIAVALGAVALGVLLTRAIPGNAGGILAIVIGIAAYIALRIALNRLTDGIAKRHLNSRVDRSIRKTRKAEADGKVRDARLLEAIANETNQDRLLKAVRESQDFKVGRPCSVTFEQAFKGAKRLDPAHLNSLIQWWGRNYCPRVSQKLDRKTGEPLKPPALRMRQLIDLLPDPDQRAKLKAYYYLD